MQIGTKFQQEIIFLGIKFLYTLCKDDTSKSVVVVVLLNV